MDPTEFRAVGTAVVERLAKYFENVDNLPLFPDVAPDHLAALFADELPRGPTPAGDVLAELETKLFPYLCHVGHPGYFGYITPSPTPMGALGDLIAAALNQNLALYAIGPGAVAMERQTVRWLTDLVGYGDGGGGHLTSGGTLANLTGLKLARDWTSGDAAQTAGVTGPMAAYTSEERHVSVDKAADMIGIGRDGLRVVPTDDRFRIRIDALEEAIARDRAAGVRPICIVAMGGSTATGAVDPLLELRRIADREKMWLHVDAAYGGGMLLSREHPGLLHGIETADSVTLDPHKWFYAPLDAGAILVRDAARLTASFGMAPAYLVDRADEEGERYDYYVHGFEQSRRFRSLKVWMSFKRYGAAQIGEWVDANVAHARRLYSLATAAGDFEAATEPPMSAICIRYTGGELAEPERARLHAAVARRVEESGRFWISTTVLKGHTWFRINPVNFRTRTEHVEGLFAMLRAECGAAAGAAPRNI
ncbi:MAG: aminotransferase class I/II-fold pyridoxal phosphate-dependent enzyme [Gemmatimonadota bacterium]